MDKETIRTVALAEIVEDYTLYPRTAVDRTHVTSLSRVLEAGGKLPPMVVEKGTLRLVDGWHRLRAYRHVLGADAKMSVEVRAYDSEAALYADALVMNAPHGKRLTAYDIVTAITKGEKIGLTRDVIATSLSVKREYVDGLVTSRTAIGGNGKKAPLKYTVRHMAGKPLSESQLDVMPRVGGLGQPFYVNQVLLLLRNHMVDTGNENLMASLRDLYDALRTFLAHKEKGKPVTCKRCGGYVYLEGGGDTVCLQCGDRAVAVRA